MGRYKARVIDRNRFSKKYPFVRAPKRPAFLGTTDIALELGTLTFNNESSKDFYFEAKFDSTDYNIMLVARDTGTGESAAVNLYVDNALSDTDKVRVSASAAFTGQVDIVAIRID